jgi:hypothetical protein
MLFKSKSHSWQGKQEKEHLGPRLQLREKKKEKSQIKVKQTLKMSKFTHAKQCKSTLYIIVW